MSLRKFVIIGCQHGHISMVIEEMRDLGVDCAGIYERDPQPVAQAIAERYHIPLFTPMDYAGIDALLDPSVELVASSAINSEKIDLVELCERHGKHMLLDKPAVTSLKGYERLKAVIDRGRIQIGMLLTERTSPGLNTLKRHIDAGVLGQIVTIGTRRPHRLSAANRPAWFFSKEQNGGLVLDLLIHDYDVIRWLTGKEVIASEGYLAKNILPEYPTFYDTTNVQVLMEDQIVAQLYTDWHTRDKSWAWGDERFFITGTKGMAEMRLAGDPMVSIDALYLLVTNEAPLTSVPLDAVNITLCGDFLNRIAGKSTILTHKDILAACKAAVEADEAVKIIVRS